MRASTVALIPLCLASYVCAGPVTSLQLGVEPITVNGQIYPVGAGGGFAGTVDGTSTYFWCVDDQDFFSSIPTSFSGNLVPLGNWTSSQTVTVETTSSPTWGDGLSLTALQRYQAAAWLIMQYSDFPNGPTGTSADAQIQDAIWRLTFVNGRGGTIPATNSFYNSAVAFISNPANSNFSFGNFAVVASSTQLQLVQVAATVPEPGTLCLLGASLFAVGMLRRRRSSR